MHKRKNEEEVHRAYQVTEYKQVVKRVRCQKAQQYRLLRYRKCRAPDNNPHSQGKQTRVQKKCGEPTSDKPIKKLVVCPVKPLLLAIHRRLIIFVEHVTKVLLPPSCDWPLQKSTFCHVPNLEASLCCFVGKRYRSETLQCRSVLYYWSIAKCKKCNNQHSNGTQAPQRHPAKRAPLCLLGTPCNIYTRDNKPAEEP